MENSDGRNEVEKLVETTNCSLLMLMLSRRSLDLMVESDEKKRKVNFCKIFQNLIIPPSDLEFYHMVWWKSLVLSVKW